MEYEDRAERIVREKAKKRGWTEQEIQSRIAARRWARKIGMKALFILADAGIDKAENAIHDRYRARFIDR